MYTKIIYCQIRINRGFPPTRKKIRTCDYGTGTLIEKPNKRDIYTLRIIYTLGRTEKARRKSRLCTNCL